MSEITRPAFRNGFAFWLIQALALASVAVLQVFSDGDWLGHFEQYQLVRNFMANPVEMIAVEAFGTLCILVGRWVDVATLLSSVFMAGLVFGTYSIGKRLVTQGAGLLGHFSSLCVPLSLVYRASALSTCPLSRWWR